MISPKHLHDSNILARRILWLKAQASSINDPHTQLISMTEIAGAVDCAEPAADMLRRWLKERIANEIDDTKAKLRAAGVDPEGEWPER